MMSESTTMGAFSLGFSADLIGPDGKSFFGNAASDFLADYPHVRIGWLEQARAEIGADQLRPFQAAIIGGAKVTQQSVCESKIAELEPGRRFLGNLWCVAFKYLDKITSLFFNYLLLVILRSAGKACSFATLKDKL